MFFKVLESGLLILQSRSSMPYVFLYGSVCVQRRCNTYMYMVYSRGKVAALAV